MSQGAQPEFGKIRSFLWPVHNYELKKILPMFLMFFFISFNYTILRDTKDVLVVKNMGAEAIPFLKLFGTTTGAILFMIIYAKLSNKLSKEALFYTAIAPFLVFFALFPTLIYPNREALQPIAFTNMLQASLPEGFGGLIGCIRYWHYAVFYVLAELWGSAVLSLLFWGFANEIMKVTEAKRVYTLLGIGANIALLCSGPYIMFVSNIRKSLPEGTPNSVAWQISLNYLLGMFLIAGIGIIIIYWWMNRNVLTDPMLYSAGEVKQKKSKPKLSLKDSFMYLAQSKYVLCIAMLVIAYGMSINMVEVTWKSSVGKQFESENDMSTFMGLFSTLTGAFTIVMMFVGGYIIRTRGWGFAAMITPAVLLITSAAFFAFILFRDNLEVWAATIGFSTTMLAVMIGMAQNIASKSTKYSLFDPTKEMSYIPLDQEAKVKGKAAIDVVGARLGKSGGSMIQAFLLLILGNIASIAPYIAAAVLVTIIGWMFAVRSLSKQFVELTGESAPKSKPSETAPVKA